MKTSTFKKIISTAFCVMMLLSVIFLISSCKELHSHTFDNTFVGGSCDIDPCRSSRVLCPAPSFERSHPSQAFIHS